MIKVVYGYGSIFYSILEFILLFLIVIFLIRLFCVWMGKAGKKVNIKHAAIILFLMFSFVPNLVGGLFSLFNPGLKTSQYETFLESGSHKLRIRSKDPSLKSEKMLFYIKKGVKRSYTKDIRVLSLNGDLLIVDPDFSSSKAHDNLPITISKKYLNFRNE